MKFYVASTEFGNGDGIIDRYPWLKDFEYEGGQITVENLEALMDLVNKTGPGNSGICVFPNHKIYNPEIMTWVTIGVPHIEIYDGYRE